jgi:hypothetical protein
LSSFNEIMPTRIVILSKEEKKKQQQQRSLDQPTGPPLPVPATPPAAPRPSFRASLLRELQVRTDDDLADIRGSPRLLGYLFSLMASAVMLVSVVQFYRQRGFQDDAAGTYDPYYYFSNNGLVYRWKLWGAVCVSSAGMVLSLWSVWVHLDTFVAPAWWAVAVRDGSRIEQVWIGGLLLFWAAGVHICTSTLSVGESQPNVYFATWIAFGATAMNYSVWRASSGRAETVWQREFRYPPRRRNRDSWRTSQRSEESQGADHRETTYNWLWVGFFSCIFAGAATDIYFNRDNIVLRLRGEPLNLHSHDWIIILTVVWSEVALCGLAVLLNTTWSAAASTPSCRLPRCTIPREERPEHYRCVFGWRQVEGLVILFTTGLKFWVILKYAAVDGVIPGLSNAYFGVWGSFFNGVFCFGTWLRENKNIEYIVLDAPPESDRTNGTPGNESERGT